MAAAEPSLNLPNKPNLRPTEIAAFLDCSLTTVYELIHSPGFPVKKVNRQFRIPRAAFLAWYGNLPAVESPHKEKEK